jgi:dihydrolipoamide dehydrogenase
LSGLAKQRKVQVVTGRGEFATPNTIKVETADGVKTVAFEQLHHCRRFVGGAHPRFPYDDKRISTSTGALELTEIPNACW